MIAASASLRLGDAGDDETFVAFETEDGNVLIHFPNEADGSVVIVPTDDFLRAMTGFVALLSQMPRPPVKLKDLAGLRR